MYNTVVVRNILRFEGITFFIASVWIYANLSGNWSFFILLLFVPDISMIGYFIDRKLGAALYNLMHNYVLGFILLGTGWIGESSLFTSLGLILIAHVGMDRFFGFGLKYSSAFKDTHLQKV